MFKQCVPPPPPPHAAWNSEVPAMKKEKMENGFARIITTQPWTYISKKHELRITTIIINNKDCIYASLQVNMRWGSWRTLLLMRIGLKSQSEIPLRAGLSIPVFFCLFSLLACGYQCKFNAWVCCLMQRLNICSRPLCRCLLVGEVFV